MQTVSLSSIGCDNGIFVLGSVLIGRRVVFNFLLAVFGHLGAPIRVCGVLDVGLACSQLHSLWPALLGTFTQQLSYPSRDTFYAAFGHLSISTTDMWWMLLVRSWMLGCMTLILRHFNPACHSFPIAHIFIHLGTPSTNVRYGECCFVHEFSFSMWLIYCTLIHLAHIFISYKHPVFISVVNNVSLSSSILLLMHDYHCDTFNKSLIITPHVFSVLNHPGSHSISVFCVLGVVSFISTRLPYHV